MSRLTQDTAIYLQTYTYEAITLWLNFPVLFRFIANVILQSFNPEIAVTISVWAVSSSLAATKEIDVSFSSSWY